MPFVERNPSLVKDELDLRVLFIGDFLSGCPQAREPADFALMEALETIARVSEVHSRQLDGLNLDSALAQIHNLISPHVLLYSASSCDDRIIVDDRYSVRIVHHCALMGTLNIAAVFRGRDRTLTLRYIFFM
jgi:hypothetical protein